MDAATKAAAKNKTGGTAAGGEGDKMGEGDKEGEEEEEELDPEEKVLMEMAELKEKMDTQRCVCLFVCLCVCVCWCVLMNVLMCVWNVDGWVGGRVLVYGLCIVVFSCIQAYTHATC